MDSTVLDVKDLPAYNKSPLSQQSLDNLKKDHSWRKNWPKTPFPIDLEINKRVALYDGELDCLKADAIVNPTNENLTYLSYISKLAGPELESYTKKKVRICSTGDVRTTPGFESNFSTIIHAVPPKYQPKYKTAAETALFHTYFRILETMIEKKLRTVIMPMLATSKCNLPVKENFNLQLRIIRRILEQKKHEFDKIVVHANVSSFDAADAEYLLCLYNSYFPSTHTEEELACYYLSSSIGGPNGEPVIPEREIRIKSKPFKSHEDQSIDLYSGLDLSTVVGKTAFSKMREDLDKDRRRLTQNACKANDNKALVTARPLHRNVLRGCTLL